MKIVKSTTDWIWPAGSGSIIYDTNCDKNGNLTFSARNSAGKNVTAKFKVGENPYNGGYWFNGYAIDSDDYLGYVVYQTTDEPSVKKTAKSWAFEVTFAIDLVDKNGKVRNIWKKRATELTCYSGGTGNYFVFSYINDVEKTCVYDLKKGKVVTYSSNDLISSKGSSFMKSNGKTVNSKTETYDLDCFQGTRYDVAVATYQPRQGSKNKTTAYRLVDLSSKKASCLSDDYKEMETLDGKIFLVKTYDDKWGFINAKGKFLGAFDGAGAFKGNYAPVIKNGKAYLVDRNLKCVSEKISATTVVTLSDGLYYVENGSKKYLMTYASGNGSATTKPSTTKPSAGGRDISGLEYYKLENEEYTGTKICPDPSIYDGNYLLEEKTDYTLSYKNNKALGTGTVIVKGCGKYSGTKTLKFSIVLKKPSLSAKKNGNTKAVLSWKKITGASGYEIYYSTGGESFKKLTSASGSELSKTASGLDFKNNSYKFKIRAYAKNSNGKTVYSSWSKAVTLG